MDRGEAITRYIKDVQRQCLRHFPDCKNCPFYMASYYNCSVRQLGKYLESDIPQDYDLRKLEKAL